MRVARISYLCSCAEALPPFTQVDAEKAFWMLCAYTTRLAYVSTALGFRRSPVAVSIPVTEGL